MPYFWHFPMQLLGRIRQLALFSQLITYMEMFLRLEVMGTLTPQVFTEVHGPHSMLSASGYNSSTLGVSTVKGPTHLTRELPSRMRLGSGATNQCQHLCVKKQWSLNNVGVTASGKSTSNIESASLYTGATPPPPWAQQPQMCGTVVFTTGKNTCYSHISGSQVAQ